MQKDEFVSSQRQRPPFIADQRLARLLAVPTEKIHWITPRSIQHARWRTITPASREQFQTEGTIPAGWYTLQNRESLLHGWPTYEQGRKLMCVLSDAGRGKSTLLNWFRYALSLKRYQQRSLVVFLNFDELPKDFHQLWSETIPEKVAKDLGDQTWKLSQAPQLLRLTKLTLLVDAMDQLGDTKAGTAGSRVQALANLIQHQPDVNVIVSGRSSAIEAHWSQLFEPCRGEWEFIQVADFTPEQAETYLGEERWTAIQHLDAATLTIPRALEFLFELNEQSELPHIQSRGELYWYCLSKLFGPAINKQDVGDELLPKQIDYLLCLLAQEMTCQQQFGRLEGDALDEFLIAVWEKRCSQLRRIMRNDKLVGNDLDKLMARLLRLNHLTDPGVFQDHLLTDSPGNLKVLAWNNPTLQAFYTAMWMVRYAEPGEMTAFLESDVIPKTKRKPAPIATKSVAVSSHEFEDFVATDENEDPEPDQNQADDDDDSQEQIEFRNEMLRFLVEVPGDQFPLRVQAGGFLRKDDKFLNAVRLLFARDERRGNHAEWMWRAWPELLRLAGYELDRQASEREVQKVTRPLAEEVHDWILNQRRTDLPPRLAQNPAKAILWGFLSEFPRLCLQRDGAGEIARSLRFDPERDGDSKSEEGQYCQCPPDGKAHTFVMGSPDGEFRYPDGSIPPAEQGRYENETPHVVTVSRFWIRKHVITNSEYELFDASHGSKRDKYSEKDNQPVLWVNWYEAMMYSRWLGPGMQLPSEAQWEAACRAGTQTAYSFGNDTSQLGEYAWWYGNCRKEQYAHEVGKKAPNEWGLHDMHGNVWEWCGDWYGAYDTSAGKDPMGPSSGSRRVNRGGGGVTDPAHCRTANRDRDSPDFRFDYLGFRVALVPSSE